MRTCLSVRGLSLIPLCVAIAGAFACNASPTEPDAVIDSAIVAKSKSFNAEAAGIDRVDADTDGPDSDELAETEIDADSLAVNTATATTRTVVVSGVTKDKNGKRIAGVAVKIAGKRLDTTDSRGGFSINARPGVKITFSKTGYNNASETVTRAIRNMIVRLTATPAALSKLSLSDTDVPIGTTVIATVKLTKAAPSGGLRVALSSSSGVEVPASVKVSAKETSAKFNVKAESAGTATITASYDKKRVKATLRVTGTTSSPPPPTPSTPVAEFRWDPPQCEVVEESGGDPLLVKCRFDASDSDAPPNSVYRWTFPGNNVLTRNSPILQNPPLKCGSVAEGAFGRTVTLVITTPGGDVSAPRSRTVTFTRDGFC